MVGGGEGREMYKGAHRDNYERPMLQSPHANKTRKKLSYTPSTHSHSPHVQPTGQGEGMKVPDRDVGNGLAANRSVCAGKR